MPKAGSHAECLAKSGDLHSQIAFLDNRYADRHRSLREDYAIFGAVARPLTAFGRIWPDTGSDRSSRYKKVHENSCLKGS